MRNLKGKGAGNTNIFFMSSNGFPNSLCDSGVGDRHRLILLMRKCCVSVPMSQMSSSCQTQNTLETIKSDPECTSHDTCKWSLCHMNMLALSRLNKMYSPLIWVEIIITSCIKAAGRKLILWIKWKQRLAANFDAISIGTKIWDAFYYFIHVKQAYAFSMVNLIASALIEPFITSSRKKLFPLWMS